MTRRRGWFSVGAVGAAFALSIGSAHAAGGWAASPATGVTGPVSSFSDTDAWALGSSGFAHWNGSGWTQFAAPAGLGTMRAIADDGANNAWAVGAVSSGYRIVTLQIAHWNGTAWSISANLPVSARFAALSGVTALSPSNVWAVGSDGQHGLVEHFDGTSWSQTTVPDPNAGTFYGSTLTAVSARSASDVWAVGTFANPAPAPDSLYALHYDGAAWHVVTMAQTGSLTNSNSPVPSSVVDIGAGDVWMVGSQADFGSPTTLTEHWNGTAWSIVASPFDHIPASANSISDGSLAAVTARASNDVWAAGFDFTFTDGDPSGIYHALLIHWNGTSWTQDTTAPTTGTYNTVLGITSTLGGHVIWATNAGTPGLLTHA